MMIDNLWAFELESLIYSKVKAKAKDQLISKFPKINFTTSDKNDGEPIYPTVYIHELPGVEQGKDLENKSINAVTETIQVEVITNTSQSDVKKISGVIAQIFKDMSFQVDSFPTFDNGTSYYRGIMRVSRMIGHGDKI